MLKNNNGKAVRHLGICAMNKNRARNLFSVIAVILTAFMFTAVFTIGFSLVQNMDTMFIRLGGSCEQMYLTYPTAEQIKKAESCKSLEHAGIRISAGIVQAAGEDDVSLTMWYNDAENFRYHIKPALSDIKGRYPEKENEIMLSVNGLDALNINAPETGMEIPLIIGDSEKKFILTGYFKDYVFRTNAYNAFVSKEYIDKMGISTENSGVLFMSAKTFSKDKLFKQLNENIELSVNQDLIANTENNSEYSSSIAAIVLLICAVILLSGYLLIYNIIYISVSRDIRFYGLLKTIGTSPKQIKHIVKMQAFTLSAIGIPVGILLGTLTSFAAVPFAVDFFDSGSNYSAIPDKISFDPFIYVGTILFTLATVALSCRKPAKIAGSVSPVEAVKYNGQNNAKIKSKKTTGGGKLYKMAFRNVFTDKKRALLVFSSMFIGTLVLLVTQSFFSSVRAEKYTELYYPDDYAIFPSCYSDMETIDYADTTDENKVKAADKLAEDIKNIAGITNIMLNRGATIDLVFDKETYMPFIEIYAARFNESAGSVISNAIYPYLENGGLKYDIIGVDRKMMERYNEKNKYKIDIDAFERGEVCFIYGAFNEEEVKKCGNRIITLRNHKTGNEKALRADFYAMYHPDGLNIYGYGYGYCGIPDIIVSQSVIDELTDTPYIKGIIADCDPDAEPLAAREVKKLVKNNCCISDDGYVHIRSEILKDFRSTMTSMNIITAGISIVLIIIGIINFINVMLTGVFTRRSELAVMESIGMTKKQIRKMLMLEGFYYAGICAVLIMTVGNALVYAAAKWTATEVEYAVFSYPWQLTAAMTAAMLAVCVTVPAVVYGKLSKESITERLRMGE